MKPRKSDIPLTPSQRQLLTDNIGLAWAAATLFSGRYGCDLDDARDACIDAMTRCMRTFDPAKGFKLGTYVYRACSKEVWRRLARQRHRAARCPMVCLRMDDRGRRDAKIASPADRIIGEEARRLFDCLPERERAVLGLRLFEGLTLEHVGGIIGTTKERVRQIEMAATNRLRGWMERNGKTEKAIRKQARKSARIF